MTSIAQFRKAALALPETTEGVHFGMMSFSVHQKNFASLSKDKAYAQLRLDADDVDKTIDDLGTGERIERSGKPIGVAVRLDAINGMQLNAIVRRSWMSQAPRALVREQEQAATAADGEVGDLPAGLGRPATRALVGAGLTTLARVAEAGRAAVAELHGVGPKALSALDRALDDHGLSW